MTNEWNSVDTGHSAEHRSHFAWSNVFIIKVSDNNIMSDLQPLTLKGPYQMIYKVTLRTYEFINDDEQNYVPFPSKSRGTHECMQPTHVFMSFEKSIYEGTIYKFFNPNFPILSEQQSTLDSSEQYKTLC